MQYCCVSSRQQLRNQLLETAKQVNSPSNQKFKANPISRENLTQKLKTDIGQHSPSNCSQTKEPAPNCWDSGASQSNPRPAHLPHMRESPARTPFSGKLRLGDMHVKIWPSQPRSFKAKGLGWGRLARWPSQPNEEGDALSRGRSSCDKHCFVPQQHLSCSELQEQGPRQVSWLLAVPSSRGSEPRGHFRVNAGSKQADSEVNVTITISPEESSLWPANQFRANPWLRHDPARFLEISAQPTQFHSN